MNRPFRIIVGFVAVLVSYTGFAQSFPRVEERIATYETDIKKLRAELDRMTPNTSNKEWVKKKLEFMYQQDQYTRKFIADGYRSDFNDDERRIFSEKMLSRMDQILKKNLSDLKNLLNKYVWINISAFNARADNQAWLIVASATFDKTYQKKILPILKLYVDKKDTSGRNYAYLYDQIAVSDGKKQSFGTQGQCEGPGIWRPAPIDDEAHVNDRRLNLGMEPLEDFVKRFEKVCA